ncbi:MAG: PAS domain S-box protein [Bacteroidales bacterium]
MQTDLILHKILQSKTAFMILNESFDLLGFSPGIENVLSFGHLLQTGDHLWSVLPKSIQNEVYDCALNVKNNQDSSGFVIKDTGLKDQKNHDFVLNITYTPGEGFFFLFTPFSESLKKSAEEHRQMEVMRTTLDSMDDFVFVLDKDGLFSEFYADHERNKLTDIDNTFSVGSKLSDVGFPNDVVKLFSDAIRKIEKTRVPEQINYSLKAFGGELYYQAKVSPRFSFDGNFEGVTVVSRDISTLIKSEIKLKKSLEYYLTVFDHFPSLIWRSNTKKKLDYFNKTWVQFTGKSLESEMGDGWKKGIHPDDREKILPDFNDKLTTHKPFTLQYRLLHKSGHYRWVKNFCEPLIDFKGRFTGYIGSCFDIDDILHTQKLLQQSQSRYKTILHQQNDLVTRWKPDLSVSFVNNSVCKFLGKPYQEFNGIPWVDLFPKSEKEKVKQYLKTFLKNNEQGSIELEGVDQQGKSHVYQWLTAPIYDEEGKIVEYQSVGRDISDKIKKQEENQNLLTNLQYKIQELSLLNDVSKIIGTGNDYKVFLPKIIRAITNNFGRYEKNAVKIEYQGQKFQSDNYTAQPKGVMVKGSFGKETKGELIIYLPDSKNNNGTDQKGSVKESKNLLNLICELLHSHFLKIEAEKKLKVSELRYRELFDNALDIIFSIDLKANIHKTNPAAARILGFENMEGNNLWEVILPSEKPVIKKMMEKTIREGDNSFSFETKAFGKDGEVKSLQVRGFVKFIDGQKPGEIFGIARDITQQRMLEKSIMKTVISTEEKERKRFAEDLHDGIGPLLSGLKMYMQQETLAKGMSEKQLKVLKYCREITDDAISQTRSIANNLTPGVLNDFGLQKALISHVDKINAIGKFSIVLAIKTPLQNIDEDVSIAVFRVVSELINNTLKYAECKNVKIEADIKKNILSLHYEDDGKGFNLQKQLKDKPNGMGLNNIYNRVNSLNGSVNFKTSTGKGFLVKIFIPLKEYNDK